MTGVPFGTPDELIHHRVVIQHIKRDQQRVLVVGKGWSTPDRPRYVSLSQGDSSSTSLDPELPHLFWSGTFKTPKGNLMRPVPRDHAVSVIEELSAAWHRSQCNVRRASRTNIETYSSARPPR